MRRFIACLAASVFAIACSVSNTGTGSPSGETSPSPTNGGNTSGNAPAPSQTAAEIDIDGTCSAHEACGGNPQGTFDYTGGCIADAFAGARDACAGLDTTKAVVRAKGSVTFSGNALTRAVTVTTSGTITFPQSCTMGQCAAVESELKGAFDSVSCTGSSACTCTISKIDKTDDVTTYTIQGSVVTTADGDQYSICENGVQLSYSGKSAGSEQGTFTLKKR
jgi:hypothetical protein